MLEHSTEIEVDASSAFEACRRVDNWSRFMPAVKSANFIEVGDSEDVIQITAEMNSGVRTWRSRRRLDTVRHIIEFEQLDVPAQVQFMRGSWTISEHRPGTVLVTLRHEFAVDPSNDGLEKLIVAAIKSNATRDLEAMKEYLRTA